MEGGWLPSLFPVSDILGLADPLAAGQVAEAQHGHSAPRTSRQTNTKCSVKKCRHLKVKCSRLKIMDANLYSFELMDPDLGVKFNLNFEKMESLNTLKKILLSQIFNFFPQKNNF
jgi:hypothetical protein